MNAETKLFLVLFVVASAGLGLVAYGLGLNGKLAASGVGVLVYFGALRGMAALWKDRS